MADWLTTCNRPINWSAIKGLKFINLMKNAVLELFSLQLISSTLFLLATLQCKTTSEPDLTSIRIELSSPWTPVEKPEIRRLHDEEWTRPWIAILSHAGHTNYARLINNFLALLLYKLYATKCRSFILGMNIYLVCGWVISESSNWSQL